MGAATKAVTCAALLLIALAASANDPQQQISASDTVTPVYVITYVDTTAFRLVRIYQNHRKTLVVVPPHAKSGDTLLVAEVWEGVPRDLIENRAQLEAAKQGAEDYRRALETLDSALTAKKKRP